jgi:hypothetical protein
LATVGHRAYGVDVGDDITAVGDGLLVDGMTVSLRYRPDFVVTDAAGLLDAARRAFCELNPQASSVEAVASVTCAADAIYTILERDGLIGDAIDARLADHGPDGIEALGWRAEVVDEPAPLRPGWDCLRTGDVFALPTSASGEEQASQSHIL